MERECENYTVMPELAQSSSVHLLPKISHNLLLPARKPGRDPLLFLFINSHGRQRTPSRSHTTNTASAMARRSSQDSHHKQLQPMAGHRVTASPGRGSHGNGAGGDINNTGLCPCVTDKGSVLSQWPALTHERLPATLDTTSLKLLTSPGRYLWHVHYPESEHLEEKRLWILLPIL